MSFDSKIGAAYIDNGVKHRILGVRLRPFCLWHLMLLQVLDSPFIHKGSVELGHLKVAVAVCRLRYRESRLRKPLWPLKLHQRALEQRVGAFLDYVGDYLNEPEYTIVPHGTSGRTGKVTTPPPRVVTAAFNAAHGARCSIGEAWEMPIGEAYMSEAMYLRNQGADLDFMDEEEREEQRKMRESGFKSI